MQTFLPYPDFERSAKVLDYRRLGKQRVEAKQILNALTTGDAPHGWRNHPATKMWRGYEDALAIYKNKMIEEWCRRGYKNTMSLTMRPRHVELPPWWGDEKFHAAHRSNLLRKDPEWYGQFGWAERDDLPYIWPVR